jgi:type IV pilus assembly protein PilC
MFKNFGIGKEKQYFIEQLSMLLGAGMPVATALSAIGKEIKSGRLKKIIAEIGTDLESVESISSYFEKSANFARSTISLIRIGEESGRLSENLKVVALQEQKDREFRSKLTSAMMYPGFVFTLTIVVGLGIAWFILPRLANVFASLHAKLPLITVWLIALGKFLGNYGIYVIPIFFAVSLLLMFFVFIFKKTNFLGQAILFHLPGISGLLQEVELARFGSLLGNLLAAGLPVLDSLESLAESSALYRYKKFYIHLHERVKEGNSFQKSFELYKGTNNLIPTPIQQLVVTAEQSGNLAPSLIKIGEMYERKTEDTAKNLTVLLEPILLVIVWLGVVAVAMAVILPLYSLLGSLNSTGPSPAPAFAPAANPAPSPTPTAPPPAAFKLKILKTTTGYLNVRTAPSLTAGIIKQVSPGEIFTYTASEKDWYKIEYGTDSYGWVFGDYVEEIK